MKAAFRAYLLANGPLSEAVGSRVAWGFLPRAGGLPAVALGVIGPGFDYTYKRLSATRRPLVRITCWAATPDDADALKELVIAACSTPVGEIRGVFLQSERDGEAMGDGPRADTTRDVYRTSLEVRVWFKPAA